MPVRKFRTIEEMNAFDRERRRNLDPESAGRRLFGIWQLVGGIGPRMNFPKGVHKFRSIEEMNAFKERYEDERFARIQAERVKK
jgi:hypothetical protein